MTTKNTKSLLKKPSGFGTRDTWVWVVVEGLHGGSMMQSELESEVES